MNAVILKPRVRVRGLDWFLYDVKFYTAEGTFMTHIYACSTEHAAAILGELRETAVLDGQVIQAGRLGDNS